MLNIRILVVGKIKEKYFRNALDQYLKRLSRFTKIEIIEVKDEATPEKASKSENLEILQTEGGRLLDKINNRDFVIALAIEGKLITSPDLADMIREIPLDGYSTID
ncbi:23S rRNA (pseudouridine(1915)-N(3))-methyltransferase RlmH, partial [Oenococcus oeni]